ncbi:hypothetical protein JG688_00018682, partial [Phytophthora aleatoria]
RVREYDIDSTKSAKRKRLTDPAERTRLRDRDDIFQRNKAADSDSGDESVVGPDHAFEYWNEVLCELEDDDDPPVARDNSVAAPQDAAASDSEIERRFTATVITIRRQSLEPIPERDRTPLPEFKYRQIPQEKTMPGLRGQKVSLEELSSVDKKAPRPAAVYR